MKHAFVPLSAGVADEAPDFTAPSENVYPIFPDLNSRRGGSPPLRGVRQPRGRPYIAGHVAGASSGGRTTPDALQTDRTSLSALRFFMAVYTGGKMSRVAADMRVTTSTVSTSIARLAQMFGTELFRSTGRGLVPTPAAHRLAPRIQEMMQLWDSILEDVRAPAADAPLPDLEIACPEYLLLTLTRLQAETQPMDLVVRHVLPTWDDMQRLYGEQGTAVLSIVDPREETTWEGEQHTIARFSRRWLVARRGHPVLAETPTLDAAYDCRWIGIEGSTPRGAGEGRLSLDSWSSLGHLLADSDQVCFCSDVAAHYLVTEYGLEAFLMPSTEHEPCELRLLFSGGACPPVIRRWLMQVLVPTMEQWIETVLETMNEPVVSRRRLRGFYERNDP